MRDRSPGIASAPSTARPREARSSPRVERRSTTRGSPRPGERALKRLLQFLVLAAFTALQPASALAQSAVDKARIYFDAGVQAYGVGRYAAAVEAFTEAYALAAKPTVLFSLAQSERRQFTVERDPRRLRDALVHFRRYLQEVPEGGRRSDAVEALAELEVMAARVDAAALTDPPRAAATDTTPQVTQQARLIVSTATKDAVISVDGVEHRDLPVIQVLTAGRHVVRASSPGYVDEEKEITAVPGLMIPLEFALQERPSYLDINATVGAVVTVDGHREGTAPLGAVLDIAPGAHLVIVTKTGCHPYSETVTLDRGQTLPLRITLRRTPQRTLSYVVFGASAAALVSAVALGGAAALQESTVRSVSEASTAGNISQARLDAYNAALASRDRLRTASFVMVSAGSALALTGASLFVFDDPIPAESKRRSVRVLPRTLSLGLGPEAAVVGVGGAF